MIHARGRAVSQRASMLDATTRQIVALLDALLLMRARKFMDAEVMVSERELGDAPMRTKRAES